MNNLQKAQKTGAAIVTTLLHPLLIPTLGILILFTSDSYYSYTPIAYKRIMYLGTFGITCLIPALIMPLMSLFGNINFTLTRKKDTFALLIILGIFYYTAGILVKQVQFLSGFRIFALGVTAAIMAGSFLNIWLLVNVALISTGAFSGIFLALGIGGTGDFLQPFIIFILASGLIGSACLIRKSHSPAQIYSSFFLGFGLLFLIFNFLI